MDKIHVFILCPFVKFEAKLEMDNRHMSINTGKCLHHPNQYIYNKKTFYTCVVYLSAKLNVLVEHTYAVIPSYVTK